jgi:hypothetical protein
VGKAGKEVRRIKLEVKSKGKENRKKSAPRD